MDLQLSQSCFCAPSLYNRPQSCEANDHDNGQKPNGPVLSFLEHFDQAVEESCEPEKPFQGGCAQNEAHDGNENNLTAIVNP